MHPKEYITRMIEASGNPMAAIILTEAYQVTKSLGCLAIDLGADKAKTKELGEKLLAPWPDDNELTELSGDPAWVAALSMLLHEAIISMVNKTVHGRVQRKGRDN
jgi:hypothetical protein